MKKLLKVLAVGIFALTPFLVGAPAYAQATCSIGFTGPDSNNMCTSVTSYSCTVENTNVVTITNGNTQVVQSGSVTVTGNSQGGNSTSGTVSNTNGATFTVIITNPPQGPGLGTCFATQVVPAEEPPTPTQYSVQPTGGGGATELPATSGNSTLTILIVTVGSLAILAAVGVGGVALYRYYKSL